MINEKEINKEQPIDQRNQWRNDFPVDTIDEEYVERREFTKFLILISGSFVTGHLFLSIKNYFRKTVNLLPIVKVARVQDLKIGDSLLFSYPEKNDSCVLIRLSEEDIVAFSNKCTHLMCPVVPKFEEKKLFCPCHSGFFDIKSGAPIAGPPKRPLPKIKLKIEQGTIFAHGIEV